MRESVTCAGLQSALHLDPQHTLTCSQREHLAACEACADALLTDALAQRPAIAIPAGFAARVAAHAIQGSTAGFALHPTPAPRASFRMPAYGLTAAIAILSLLAFALGLYAWADPSSIAVDPRLLAILGWIISLEIAGIALWLAPRRPAM